MKHSSFFKKITAYSLKLKYSFLYINFIFHSNIVYYETLIIITYNFYK